MSRKSNIVRKISVKFKTKAVQVAEISVMEKGLGDYGADYFLCILAVYSFKRQLVLFTVCKTL